MKRDDGCSTGDTREAMATRVQESFGAMKRVHNAMAEVPGLSVVNPIACFPEQGWSLLCNGVIMFEDTGEILPDGSCVSPHRGPALHALA